MEENNTRYLIRFRAWDRDNGTLYKWDCYENYPLNGKNATCPQEFIGFYDKNLKDIYLGDIVRFDNENFLIKFLDGSYILWKLENISTLKFYWFHTVAQHQKEIEVIGNTFENADYLTKCLNNNILPQ